MVAHTGVSSGEQKKKKEVSKSERDNKGLTVKKNEDMPQWYFEVVQKAELADYAPIQGFMIIRPNAYAIWERIQEEFNNVLKMRNVKNAYFPLLIPESFFKKEAEHAEGFAPELAYIESKKGEERFAIRPTSETIIYDSYSKWVRSWRDLPLVLNQWCNILRWEVTQTKPFLRTREFLWQEGHGAFETEEQAEEDMSTMINEYKKLVEEILAVPVIVGRKSEAERFKGAKKTMTIEALMPDGKALQCGTSHNLGQNFSKTFNIKFLGKDSKESFAWQTSWGFSTRLIGALIMLHGDDKGLVLPPKATKNKIAIVPILFEDTKEKVLKKCLDLKDKFSEFGAFVDSREEYSPGWKFNELELKGIPIRIEVGPKDLEKKQVVVVRRDNGKKEMISDKELAKKIPEILEDIQKSLFEKAKKHLDASITEANSIEELNKKLKEGKIVRVFMVNEPKIEDAIREKTEGANSRFVEEVSKEGVCIQSGKKTKWVAYFARSY